MGVSREAPNSLQASNEGRPYPDSPRSGGKGGQEAPAPAFGEVFQKGESPGSFGATKCCRGHCPIRMPSHLAHSDPWRKENGAGKRAQRVLTTHPGLLHRGVFGEIERKLP